MEPSGQDRFVGRAFVGRAAERAELDALAGERLIVIAGPPGVGKSRLCAEWAGARALRADLGAAHDLEDALRRVARALELDVGPSEHVEAVIDRIADVLRSRAQVVLWLDDADAVIEGLAEAVGRWRDAKLVITSRRAVLDAPHVHLRPLSHDEAVRLLVDRARAVRPDFTLSDAQAPSAGELVRRLDALPLAIELVAPRLRLLSPAQLLARLTRAVDRDDALALAIERSLTLLQPWERDALEQCAVFRDGFYLEAAEAVIDLSAHRGAPDVLTVLEALVAQSLLRTEAAAELPDEVRVRHFGAVQEHAARSLARDPERAAEAEQRHARYFAERAEGWDAGIESPDEAACTARLVIELPNLEAAFERAQVGALSARLGLVLHMAYQRRGPFGRQRELVERIAALACEPGLRARAELARARVCRWEGALAESDEALRRALDAALDADDVATEASVARNAAANRFRAGDLDGFQRHIEHALEAARKSGRASDEVNALNGLGFLYTSRGEMDRAQSALERALRLAKETEIPGLIALVHGSLSALMLRVERLGEAARHSSEAIAAYARLGYVRQWALEHIVRGEARLLVGELDAAGQDAEAALERARWLGLDAPRTRAMLLSGRVAFFGRDFARAREAIEAALARMSETDPDAPRAWAYAAAARAMLGHQAAAREALERAGDDEVSRVLGGFVDGGATIDARSAEARRAAELLAALAGDEKPCLELADRWFRVEGGPRVDLTRKRALRAVLGGLAEQHLTHPGEPLSIDGVLDAGWPGERMSPESGARRVYVTINRLRKMGLGELLLTTGEGYMLAPHVQVQRM